MRKLHEVIRHIEAWAPKAWQEGYDNNGLLVGDANQEVHGVLVTLDVTEAVLAEAKEKGCNVVIGHHPLIFKGIKSLAGDDPVSRTIRMAIKEDIAVYALHTNLDHAGDGVSFEMAQRMGLSNLHVLDPQRGRLKKLEVFVPAANKEGVLKALHEAGAGEIGNYSQCSFQTSGQGTFFPKDGASPAIGQVNRREEVQEVKIEVLVPAHLESLVLRAMYEAHPYEEIAYFLSTLDNLHQNVGAGIWGEWDEPKPAQEVLAQLKSVFQVPVIRHTAIVKDPIRRVALCGGAGSFLIGKALSRQADLFISSDFKYHDFFEADGRIILADIGHFESEQFTKDLIVTYLSKKFTNFAIHLSGIQTNPINYFV